MTTFEVFSDDPLSSDRVLRRLEVLRKHLTVRWSGSEGAFAGYDVLEVSSRIGRTEGTVHLEALLFPQAGPSVVVQMRARGRTTASAAWDSQEDLVRGSGRSLLLAGTVTWVD